MQEVLKIRCMQQSVWTKDMNVSRCCKGDCGQMPYILGSIDLP